jgi:hypothetical protein
MATLTVDGNHLMVLLSALEKIGALRGNISVPLASVRVARVSDTPWSELRGIRAPGTDDERRAPAVDGGEVVDTRPQAGAERNDPGQAEMTGASFDRLVVTCADAAEAAARAADITRASGLADAPR